MLCRVDLHDDSPCLTDIARQLMASSSSSDRYWAMRARISNGNFPKSVDCDWSLIAFRRLRNDALAQTSGSVRDRFREEGRSLGRSCFNAFFRHFSLSQHWRALRLPVPHGPGIGFPSPHLARTQIIPQPQTKYVQAKGKTSMSNMISRGLVSLESLEYWGSLFAMIGLNTTSVCHHKSNSRRILGRAFSCINL